MNDWLGQSNIISQWSKSSKSIIQIIITSYLKDVTQYIYTCQRGLIWKQQGGTLGGYR